jgi:hypothetical protein
MESFYTSIDAQGNFLKKELIVKAIVRNEDFTIITVDVLIDVFLIS